MFGHPIPLVVTMPSGKESQGAAIVLVIVGRGPSFANDSTRRQP